MACIDNYFKSRENAASELLETIATAQFDTSAEVLPLVRDLLGDTLVGEWNAG